MTSKEKIYRYFSYIKINKFRRFEIKNYPKISYKHFLRFPRSWLKRKLSLNKDSKILAKLLLKRRSIREYRNGRVLKDKINYILTTSLGITEFEKNYRAYPSPGGLYPIECYLLLLKPIEDICPGVYHYNFLLNCLELINPNVNAKKMPFEVFGDNMFPDAFGYVFLTCIPSRLTWKYYTRSLALIYIEAGHIGQNIYLTAQAQNIGCCSMGGFIEDKVIEILDLRKDYEYPIYSMSLGLRK